jgi:hypothetical protein
LFYLILALVKILIAGYANILLDVIPIYNRSKLKSF